jgi:hypothetical protein
MQKHPNKSWFKLELQLSATTTATFLSEVMIFYMQGNRGHSGKPIQIGLTMPKLPEKL